MNSQQLIDLSKKKAAIPSYYRMAKDIGISESFLNNCRHGRRTLDDKTALILADIAGLDRDYVLACLAAEKEKNETVKNQWLHLAERLQPGKAAAVILSIAVCVGSALFPFGNKALAESDADLKRAKDIYYVK